MIYDDLPIQRGDFPGCYCTLEKKRVTNPSLTATSNLFDAMAFSAGPADINASSGDLTDLRSVMCVCICAYTIMYYYETELNTRIYIYIYTHMITQYHYVQYVKYVHTSDTLMEQCKLRCQFLPPHCAGRGIRGICGIAVGAAAAGAAGGAKRDRAWEAPWDLMSTTYPTAEDKLFGRDPVAVVTETDRIGARPLRTSASSRSVVHGAFDVIDPYPSRYPIF